MLEMRLGKSPSKFLSILSIISWSLLWRRESNKSMSLRKPFCSPALASFELILPAQPE